MEKEYLFYKLCKEVKKQVNSLNYLHSNAKTEKINSIVGTLTTMSEETLELVLTVFSKLTTYNPDNIFFITGNSDLLKSIFFKDGNIIEEKLGMLYDPYSIFLSVSPTITEYCYTNNIVDFNSLCFIRREPIENLIKGKTVSNKKIVDILDTLFELEETCPKFVSSLNPGPLHEMQMKIYKNTLAEKAKSDRDLYIKSLRNYNEEELTKVINFIQNNEFVEYETVKIISIIGIDCIDELVKKYGTKAILKDAFENEAFVKLSKRVPKLTVKLYDLAKSDNCKFNFKKVCEDLEQLNETSLKMIGNLFTTTEE